MLKVRTTATANGTLERGSRGRRAQVGSADRSGAGREDPRLTWTVSLGRQEDRPRNLGACRALAETTDRAERREGGSSRVATAYRLCSPPRFETVSVIIAGLRNEHLEGPHLDSCALSRRDLESIDMGDQFPRRLGVAEALASR